MKLFFQTVTTNKPLLFGAGFLSGALSIAIGISIYNAWSSSNGPAGISLYSEESVCIETSPHMRVIQVLEPNVALAMTNDATIMLLFRNDNQRFYDNQKVNIEDPKCAEQIGTYQYETRDERIKTVPVIVIK